MTSLVVLYMVQQLFLPGHVEHVAGLATVRGLLGLGPGVADQALASIIFGWYSGLVYFTPIIGGFVADRWLGKRNTVILGDERSEEHTSELQSLMRISYAVFCLKKKKEHTHEQTSTTNSTRVTLPLHDQNNP